MLFNRCVVEHCTATEERKLREWYMVAECRAESFLYSADVQELSCIASTQYRAVSGGRAC